MNSPRKTEPDSAAASMTKRELIAMHMLAALISATDETIGDRDAAEIAVYAADELISTLNQNEFIETHKETEDAGHDPRNA